MNPVGNMTLWYGAIGQVRDMYVSEGTWYGTLDRVVGPNPGELAGRLASFIDFCEDWNERTPPVLVLRAVLRRRNKNGRLGLAVMEACGVDCVSLERAIEETLPATSGSGRPVRDFSDIYTMAVRAREEALLLRHDWVGTEHLVLALFTAGDALTRRRLHTHGVTSQSFKQTLRELLRG